MKRFLMAAAALSAFAGAQQAYAVDYSVGSTNGVSNPNQAINATTGGYFQVTGDIFNGIITAAIGRSGIASGDPITDRFLFTIPQTGFGSGSVTNSTNTLLTATDLDFLAVTINGVAAQIFTNVPVVGGGFADVAAAANVPIIAGVQNVLSITYRSRGQGSYGGQLTFVPVPEPTTWALMLAGFGAIGFAMRRRRSAQPKVRFAF